MTTKLLSDVPHKDIFVHVSLDQNAVPGQDQIGQFLTSFSRIKRVFYSPNSIHPEVDAMEIFRKNVRFPDYSILTYMHTKGVTKPEDNNVQDWIELMRYFIIDKIDLSVEVFSRGYLIYGVNKTLVEEKDRDFEGAEFFYAGNFVSISLTPGMIDAIKSTPLAKSYYGLEGFWGKLCPSRSAYNAFHSRVNHYLTPFPERYYKLWTRRLLYSAIAFCYYQFYKLKQCLKVQY